MSRSERARRVLRPRQAPLALALCCAVLASNDARAAGLTGLLRRESSLLGALEHLAGKMVRGAAELERLRRRRRVIDYELSEADRRIKALERRRVERRLELQRRVKTLYKLSRGGLLRLLLEARDHADMQLRAAAASRILQRDIDELTLYRSSLSKLRRERRRLEARRRRHETIVQRLAGRQQQLKKARRTRLALLRRVRRSRRLRQQLVGELSRYERLLLRRVALLKLRIRNAGGFAGRKGRLPRPVGGPIVGGFGRAVDRATGVAITRSGVTFRPYRGVRVRAVYTGVVRLVGPVPGYGKLVLVEHGDEYFTLYGFLSATMIAQGARVRRGTVLGRAGSDPLSGKNAVYFEIRHRRQALDPTAWLRR